jgi:3-hydroxyisobutyrate dehydrogenase-like beta-hydroxyacid dehydrogenase
VNVGVVGLGRMGLRIAQRLAAAGMAVRGWDRDPAAVTALSERGQIAGTSPADVAAGSDVVISCVTEDDGVRAIFTAPGGFLAGDVRGKLFLEMSTLRPRTARELAPTIEACGAAFVDSPVLGSLPNVEAGTLHALVGGRAADVERATVVLDHLASRVTHLGPTGSGYAMKLAANLGLAAYMETLAEAIAMGVGEGLTLESMLDVLTTTVTANRWIANRREILTGERSDVTLDIRTMRKDVQSALATGSASGVAMPLAAATLAAFSAAVASGWGDGDIGQMARFAREELVQRFPRPQ